MRKTFYKNFLSTVVLIIILTSFNSLNAQTWTKVWNSPTGNDVGWMCVSDAAGNVYVAGSITNAVQGVNIMFLKYDPSGNLVASGQWDYEGKDDYPVKMMLTQNETELLVLANCQRNVAGLPQVGYMFTLNANTLNCTPTLWAPPHFTVTTNFIPYSFAYDAAGGSTHGLVFIVGSYVIGGVGNTSEIILRWAIGTAVPPSNVFAPTNNGHFNAYYDVAILPNEDVVCVGERWTATNGQDGLLERRINSDASLAASSTLVYHLGSSTGYDGFTKVVPGGQTVYYVTGQGTATSSANRDIITGRIDGILPTTFKSVSGTNVSVANYPVGLFLVNNNVYTVGNTFNNGTNADMCILKYDNALTPVYENTAISFPIPGYSALNYDYAANAAVDNAGNVYIVGYNYFPGPNLWDFSVMRYNTNNTMSWVDTINSSNNGSEGGYGICLPPTTSQPVDPSVWVTGFTIVGTTNDITTAKYGPQPIGIVPISTTTPKDFAISQNYPNPFNPTTNIKFDLPKTGFVKIYVYDVLGSVVATLVNESLTAGSYKVDFDASNLSSGIYFYTINADNFTATKKMMLIK